MCRPRYFEYLKHKISNRKSSNKAKIIELLLVGIMNSSTKNSILKIYSS